MARTDGTFAFLSPPPLLFFLLSSPSRYDMLRPVCNVI